MLQNATSAVLDTTSTELALGWWSTLEQLRSRWVKNWSAFNLEQCSVGNWEQIGGALVVQALLVLTQTLWHAALRHSGGGLQLNQAEALSHMSSQLSITLSHGISTVL